MQIFNTNYKEIGDLKQNLVLNTLGKVKIRYGNKFIDLLDNKGNIVSTNNTKIPQELTNIITEFQNNEIKLSESQLLELINKYIEGDEELGIDPQFKQLVPSRAEFADESTHSEESDHATNSDNAIQAKKLLQRTFRFNNVRSDATYNDSYIFLMQITETEKLWHIKYRMYITTTNSDCLGYYDCHIGCNGNKVIYNILNEQGINNPVSSHVLVFADDYIYLGFSIYAAYDNSVFRQVKIETYDQLNCDMDFEAGTKRLSEISHNYQNLIQMSSDLGTQSGIIELQQT